MAYRKLTEQDKEEILKLHSEEGYSAPALAVKYGVSRQTIYRLVNPEYSAKQKEHAREYQKEHAERLSKRRVSSRRDFRLSFSIVKDAAVINRLDKAENANDYVRKLIIEDINREQNQ